MGGRGASSGKGKGVAAAVNEPTVRGVAQSTIDKLRGTRDHKGAHELTWEDIQGDYQRVGITITEQEAKDIRKAILVYTGNQYAEMRKALALERAGRAHDLSEHQKELLTMYKICDEYSKVAPTFKNDNVSEVLRGISQYGEYGKKLKTLKAGEAFDLDKMPTSFSSSKSTAASFAGSQGIMLHMSSSNLKNAPSIKGISHVFYEDEVLVGDYNWKIGKIDDKTSEGGYYHIYLEK